MPNYLFVILYLFLFLNPALAESNVTKSTVVEELSLTTLKEQSLVNVMASQAFTVMGETTFSILFWDLYKSTLFSTSGRYPLTSKSDALIFQINYLADISREDLIMRTVEQWQHLAMNEKMYQRYLADLETIWPNISKGDSLALLVEDNQSTFYFNGIRIGVIEDPNFGQLFIDIWLSENTSQPSLRAELLGDSYYE